MSSLPVLIFISSTVLALSCRILLGDPTFATSTSVMGLHVPIVAVPTSLQLREFSELDLFKGFFWHVSLKQQWRLVSCGSALAFFLLLVPDSQHNVLAYP